MFKIPKIEESKYYIDTTIKLMEQFAEKKKIEIDKRFSASKKIKKKNTTEINLDKRKDLELEKIRYLNKSIANKLKKILKKYPKITKIDPFYKDLINTTKTDCQTIEDSLRRILWITNKIDEFTFNTEIKIKRAKTNSTINFIMKKHLGRINSIFKKNKEYFQQLEEARKFINKLPEFQQLPTVVISGYPNVGKSTLLKKITGSDVQIQNYPFTTKGLMFGYIEKENKKQIQFIDTPGLLGRNKNNQIEQKGEIIINRYSDIIIFVIDPTETCGYTMKNQIILLRKILILKKTTLLYISKTDLNSDTAEENLKQFKQITKKHITFQDFKKLKNYILNNLIKNKKKTIDITKIKTIK